MDDKFNKALESLKELQKQATRDYEEAENTYNFSRAYLTALNVCINELKIIGDSDEV